MVYFPLEQKYYIGSYSVDDLNSPVTPSERYLAKLCRHSFLSMWSYPNIYRDQKSSATSIDGKEICDLLVVFGEHIIIFSDKYCEFPDTGNLQVDWNRWFKKAILKSARQIWGAERWFKENPDRIFVDRKCKQKLPLEFPKSDQMKIHRVAVAHGALNRCKRHFNSDSGLLINTTIHGEDHIDKAQNIFNVGWIDRKNGFVHVLDDSSLDIVLQTLDTITDFIWYLEKKERLVEKTAVFAASEEDLLGRYLHNTNEDDEHDFLPKDDEEFDYIGIEEGIWHDFLISPQRHAMIEANKVSYYWDYLVENFSHHIIANTQHYTTHPNDVSSNEKLVRFMASECRMRRRMLSNKLIVLLEKTPRNYRATSLALPTSSNEPCYIFLLLPEREDDYELYREIRREFLHACCIVAKLQYPHINDFVGIATETGINEFSSEDLLYYDGHDWREEERQNAIALQNDLGILTNLKTYRTTEREYPLFPRYGRKAKSKHIPHKLGRNSPCYCGSGKKYKHCCMRK